MSVETNANNDNHNWYPEANRTRFYKCDAHLCAAYMWCIYLQVWCIYMMHILFTFTKLCNFTMYDFFNYYNRNINTILFA